jgi:recombination endonuclease VII
VPETIRCPACGEHKLAEDFPRNKSKPSGLATYCKPCHNRIGRENREKHHGTTRQFHLRRRYGLDSVSVEWLILQQAGVCAVCRSGTPQHVDHDHANGRVRGILCFNCNRGLAKFDDDPAVLQNAMAYLQEHVTKS